MDNLTVLHTGVISIVLEPIEQIPIGTPVYSLSSNLIAKQGCTATNADCKKCIFLSTNSYYCDAFNSNRLRYLASKLPHLVSQYPEYFI